MIKYLIKKLLNKSYYYRVVAARWHKRAIEKNPIGEINRVYYIVYGKYPDLDKPKNIVEKNYWLTLHTDLTEWTRCADKYLMRDYVRECGLEKMLPINYGKYDKGEEIDFDQLPQSFVLKTNNASATCIVVKDKRKLNRKKAIKKLNHWLSIPFGYSGYQPHYLNIKPCIIAEEFLIADAEQQEISPNSLIDYKFYCCEGEPQFIWTPYNRRPQVEQNIFDLDWNSHPELLKNTEENTTSEYVLKKPRCLNEMIDAARILSKPFPYVRVDFYVIGDKPYIGELTFTPGYGFFTEELENKLGDAVDLNKVKKIR